MTSKLRAVQSACEGDVRASNGMAATSQPLASAAAIEVLKAGGTAVDAAIAANAMLGLVEPVGCGLGGDLFAMVWDPSEGGLVGLNASGRSPGGLSLEVLKSQLDPGQSIPIRGPLSLSVPGCVSGWYALHDRFGRLPMAELLAPAISTARKGYSVTKSIAREWEFDLRELTASDPDSKFTSNLKTLYAPGGGAPDHGELVSNPEQADTLEIVAEGGERAFYHGEIAERIESYVGRLGGFLTADDLSNHRSEWVSPISTDYRGFQVFELPPNTQGITALQMIALAARFDLGDSPSSDSVHALIELKKLAFEDRARLYSDPDFGQRSAQDLLFKTRVDALHGQIQTDRVLTNDAAWLPIDRFGDTCYLTTADSDGMMVSLIQSNFRKFGSGLVPDGLGFGLQNRGALFALEENHPNVFAPNKRPFQTIIPAFVLEDGRPLLSFGVMGGAMQPQGHLQILTNLIDYKMGLHEAGAAARWRHVGSSRPTGYSGLGSGAVVLEDGFSAEIANGLQKKGHLVDFASDIFGGYQAIAWDRDRNEFVGASDPRKDGMALGI